MSNVSSTELTFEWCETNEFETIWPLLSNYGNAHMGKEQFQPLFHYFWEIDSPITGVKVLKGDGKPVAYLGLIFSYRVINEKRYLFINFTSLIIDSSLRGAGITDRIVKYVIQHYPDASLTAITPIPILYKMYERNGFKEIGNKKWLIWGRERGSVSIVENKQLNFDELTNQVLADHAQFNCHIIKLHIHHSTIAMIGKVKKNRKRKFIEDRFFNLTDTLLRRTIGYSPLDEMISVMEIYYVSDDSVFCEFAQSIANYLKLNVGTEAMVFHSNVTKGKQPVSKMLANYTDFNQLFRSSTLDTVYMDNLYSEVFTLNLA